MKTPLSRVSPALFSGLWLATLVSLLLTACSANEGKFMVNNRMLNLSEARLKEVRRAWTDTSLQVASGSKAQTADITWTLDFIASLEASGVAPCDRLDLRSVVAKPLAAIRGKTTAGQPLLFTPARYHEVWSVQACGKTRDWFVFDESKDSANPHRVVLATPK